MCEHFALLIQSYYFVWPFVSHQRFDGNVSYHIDSCGGYTCSHGLKVVGFLLIAVGLT